MEEIVVEQTERGVLVCVLEHGEIVEKYEWEAKKTSTIGNIYMGTVTEVLNGMQACFVDIGLPKKAFLAVKDAMPKVDMAQEEVTKAGQQAKITATPMSQVLQKGQKVLVQIRKEAMEDKGPRVSTHVTLAGNYVVLMPETEIVTISQKITEMEEKQRLLQIVKLALSPNYGCIVRTDAVGVEEEVITKEIQELEERWHQIYQQFQAEQENSFAFLYDDNQMIDKVARDMVRRTTQKVYVNRKEWYERLQQKIEKEKIVWQEKKDWIAEFGLQGELEKADYRKIWLKCGAQIVIDKTEALTAIDVNSSRYIGKENWEETIFHVNQEAAVEIMKQLRLKDIGGIIIIDFIDMQKPEHQEAILSLLREEQKKDRSKVEVKDFTQLNLVEMTRKKMYAETKFLTIIP